MKKVKCLFIPNSFIGYYYSIHKLFYWVEWKKEIQRNSMKKLKLFFRIYKIELITWGCIALFGMLSTTFYYLIIQ